LVYIRLLFDITVDFSLHSMFAWCYKIICVTVLFNFKRWGEVGSWSVI